MSSIGVIDVQLLECNRIGKPRRDGYRLLRVKFSTNSKKRECLQKSKCLRNKSQYVNVFIKPDLTPSQQKKDWELRMELKARRANNENVMISRGKIQTRSDTTDFHQ